MIGLDTNVIVRYIVQDDPAQSAAAARLFDTFTADLSGYVSLVSVVELVWVLESCYEVGRPEIEALIESLLRSRGLVIEQAELIWRALQLFSKTNAEFADCLIERSGQIAGCEYTVTFDRSAAKTAGMQLLS
ncbi:MAG TPA: type II toxin-antitoxin system VapC family toxin [Terriglobales bacterium]|nr:type II toxin-antitoxin system VapC family toxin [Terriglobales bacterium]